LSLRNLNAESLELGLEMVEAAKQLEPKLVEWLEVRRRQSSTYRQVAAQAEQAVTASSPADEPGQASDLDVSAVADISQPADEASVATI
jgi:hypothetical protein